MFQVSIEYQIEWGVDDLFDAVRAQNSPIVGIDLRPVEGVFAFHAVAIVDITSDQVLVHDPLQGPRSIRLSTFEAAWNAAEPEAVIIIPNLTR